MDNRIKVGIRVRPLVSCEKNSPQDVALWCDKANHKIVVGADSRSRSSFAFDWCYPPNEELPEIYENMCQPLINKVFEGYHATLFACKFVYSPKSEFLFICNQ
jgi:hypothetical protein